MDTPKSLLTILKTHDDQQIAYATAIAADITDLQNDSFLPHTILQAQISFAKNGFCLDKEHDHIIISRKDVFVFDSHVYDHDQIVVAGKGVYPTIPTMIPTEILKVFGVIEKADDTIEYKILKAPALVLGLKFQDTTQGKAYWKALKEPSKDDAIRGLSIFGYSVVPKEQDEDVSKGILDKPAQFYLPEEGLQGMDLLIRKATNKIFNCSAKDFERTREIMRNEKSDIEQMLMSILAMEETNAKG